MFDMFISMFCFPVRLVGGLSPREGRLELFRDGEWGNVCDRNFDVTEAEVACYMLGFGYGSSCFAVINYFRFQHFRLHNAMYTSGRNWTEYKFT